MHLFLYLLKILSGKVVNTRNFEIPHFVRIDNQLFIYLGGVGFGV